MDADRQELLEVLREARALVARPGNDFDWSSWRDAGHALEEVDGLIRRIEAGRLPDRGDVSILFVPTGPMQETALSSGWGNEFLAVANRCDAAVEKAYGNSPRRP